MTSTRSVIPADQLLSVPDGTRVLIAGAVTHLQRPGTAGGVTFMNLEDETGMVNVLCTPGAWARHRRLAQTASALLIRGQLQKATGAVTVIAERLGRITLNVASRSRDFRLLPRATSDDSLARPTLRRSAWSTPCRR